MNNKHVFVLEHIYSFEKDNKYGITAGYEEKKMLGVYSSFERANSAAERYYKKIGFSSYDKKCFLIESYEIDSDFNWKNGFKGINTDYCGPEALIQKYDTLKGIESEYPEPEDISTIFLLFHEFEYGEDNFYEETKLLGAYSNSKKAEAAIERYYLLPGIKGFAKECFSISRYVLDKDTNWLEGFIKAEDAY